MPRARVIPGPPALRWWFIKPLSLSLTLCSTHDRIVHVSGYAKPIEYSVTAAAATDDRGIFLFHDISIIIEDKKRFFPRFRI